MGETEETLRNVGRWLRLARRLISAALLVAIAAVAAWIFWPAPQPTEAELVRLVPAESSIAVFVARDVSTVWPALRRSEFGRAVAASPWVPLRVEGPAGSAKMAEQALMRLLGKRTVGFVTASESGDGPGGLCVLAPVTPAVRWLWVQLQISQHVPGTGVRLSRRKLNGIAVTDWKGPLPPGVRLGFARVGGAVALAVDWGTDSLAALAHARQAGAGGPGPFEPALAAGGDVGSILWGGWRKRAGLASGWIGRAGAGRVRVEWELPRQRTVRVPWDAFRGPRPMGLIQKLFVDQGVATVRGRVSHYLTAWDNLVSWLGLSPDWYAEEILLRAKYREHLSHGQFPWSGAGDEFALVVSEATVNTLHGLPAITAALRCWQTNDTQQALEQFLPSLGHATGGTYLLDPPLRGRDFYTVTRLAEGRPRTLFFYRYTDGLVLVTNSPDQFERFDPRHLSSDSLRPTEPENQLWCNGQGAGAAVGTWSALPGLAEAEAVGRILRSLREVRLTIRLEDRSVRYSLEAGVE